MCAELSVSQTWRQSVGRDGLFGGGWAFWGRNRRDRCLRSGFDSGSSGGARAQRKGLGSPGSSTPHNLGWVLQIGSRHTPGGLPPPAPGAGAAGGAHLSPTRPEGGASLALGRWQSRRHSLVENHLIAQPLPGNGNRKDLGDTGAEGVGVWKGVQMPLKPEPGGSLSGEQAGGQCSDWISPGLFWSWPSEVLGSN